MVAVTLVELVTSRLLRVFTQKKGDNNTGYGTGIRSDSYAGYKHHRTTSFHFDAIQRKA